MGDRHAVSPSLSGFGCVVDLRHFWEPASIVPALGPGPTRRVSESAPGLEPVCVVGLAGLSLLPGFCRYT